MSSPRSDPILAVSFDLGGTLISASPSVGAVYAAVCREHGLEVPADLCDRSFDAAWSRRSAERIPGTDRFSSSPGGEDGWWGRVILEVLADCGVPERLAPSVEAFRRAFASPAAWRIHDDVLDTLAAVRRSGCRLAILSNWDSRMPRLLRSLGLAGEFDALICSALEGVEKPDPRIFARAAADLRTPPSSILHVGDLVREDYQGARAAGMRALWLDRGSDGVPGREEVPPEDVIASVAEVVGRLDGGRPPGRGPEPARLGEAHGASPVDGTP